MNNQEEIYYLKEQDKDPIGQILGLNASGYAGIRRDNGMLVDRREFPDAIPVKKNSMFGVAEVKKLN